jgi:hypothetical protein
VWIIQEILLASDFCLQCGPVTIDKACIKAVFLYLESKIATLKNGRRESFIGAQSPGLLRERDDLVLEMGNSMAFSLISYAGHQSTPRSIYELCSMPELAQAVLLHYIEDHQGSYNMTLESSLIFHHFLGIKPIGSKQLPISSSQMLRVNALGQNRLLLANI